MIWIHLKMEVITMIELTQRDSLNDFENGDRFDTNDVITLHISKDMVNKEIKKLTSMKNNKVMNTIDGKNIEKLIKYLKNILNKLNEEDNSIEICWVHDDDDIIHTYPISFINEKAYGIDSCNFIEVDDKQKLVEIDTTDLADIIAFEFMYKDLCETHESIEYLLKNCGIVGYEDSAILTDFFKSNNDNIFELSKSMMIGETPYFSYEDCRIIDYFNTKRFDSKRYSPVVEYSCKYANFIIMNRMIKNANALKIGIKPIMVTPTCIAFMLNDVDDNIDIHKNIIEDISIRAFGRKFVIKPNVNVF